MRARGKKGTARLVHGKQPPAQHCKRKLPGRGEGAVVEIRLQGGDQILVCRRLVRGLGPHHLGQFVASRPRRKRNGAHHKAESARLDHVAQREVGRVERRKVRRDEVGLAGGHADHPRDGCLHKPEEGAGHVDRANVICPEVFKEEERQGRRHRRKEHRIVEHGRHHGVGDQSKGAPAVPGAGRNVAQIHVHKHRRGSRGRPVKHLGHSDGDGLVHLQPRDRDRSRDGRPRSAVGHTGEARPNRGGGGGRTLGCPPIDPGPRRVSQQQRSVPPRGRPQRVVGRLPHVRQEPLQSRPRLHRVGDEVEPIVPHKRRGVRQPQQSTELGGAGGKWGACMPIAPSAHPDERLRENRHVVRNDGARRHVCQQKPRADAVVQPVHPAGPLLEHRPGELEFVCARVPRHAN
mmetsp:Transcript_29476/g.88267  ORF Transcript_29476/g.88267 Transcript_29476/m.88267 type:complete len:404 (-) Transcript_29476:383-1594(-)